MKSLIIALSLAILWCTSTKADTVNIPKNKPALIVTTNLGKNISTNVLVFANEHEAVEFENRLLASNPATNAWRPNKKPVYFVTEVFTD